jgi:Fe-S oxidoreductase
MDPRKFLRLISLGLDDLAVKSPWVWQCSMCQRCVYACPMKINIPQLIYAARSMWPREERPKGIRGSCDAALKTPANSAMGISPDDFTFVVSDFNDELKESQEFCKDLDVSMNRKGAHFFLNQNSREPVTEPDEMAPLWKILKMVGADWTYSSEGWAAENYCMFLAEDESWENIVRNKVRACQDLECKVFLNTE